MMNKDVLCSVTMLVSEFRRINIASKQLLKKVNKPPFDNISLQVYSDDKVIATLTDTYQLIQLSVSVDSVVGWGEAIHFKPIVLDKAIKDSELITVCLLQDGVTVNIDIADRCNYMQKHAHKIEPMNWDKFYPNTTNVTTTTLDIKRLLTLCKTLDKVGAHHIQLTLVNGFNLEGMTIRDTEGQIKSLLMPCKP